MNLFSLFIDTCVTLGVTLLFIGFVDVAPILTAIASGLAIAFWIPRIRREIKSNYKNSSWEYIKSIFKR